MTDFFDVPAGDYGHEGAGGEMAHDYGHGDVHDGALHRYSEPPEPDNLLYDSDGDGDMDRIFVDSDRDGDIDLIRQLPDEPGGVEEDIVPSDAFGHPQDSLGYAVDTDGDGEMDQVVIGHGGHETVYEDLDHDGDVDRTYTRDAPSGINQPRRS
ncbi:hypothetical protein [Dactylosporangium sp. NPDC006015]|uniref:hypothetical protein n=1 Tax=Dactylosporangium sp. NPDC006015 TaxID=3154576 RepID=UPI0033B05E4B